MALSYLETEDGQTLLVESGAGLETEDSAAPGLTIPGLFDHEAVRAALFDDAGFG